MIQCFFMRRKLYEYIEESLSEEDKVRVANHLELCAACRTQVTQMRRIITAAAQNQAPVPSEDFWKNFQGELDEKLNRKLVPAQKRAPIHPSVQKHVPTLPLASGIGLGATHARAVRLRAAIALATVCLVMLVFSVSLKMANHPRITLTQEDKDVIEDLSSIEELSPELVSLDEFDGIDDLQPV